MKRIALFAAPALLLVALSLSALAPRQADGADPGQAEAAARAALEQALGTAGIVADWEAGALGLPAQVLVREDLLEYLLVSPNGQAHESLFVTGSSGALLNAGLLGLGARPGKNAHVVGNDDERRIEPPSGDGFYVYAAWREGEETFLYRVEDLVANLEQGRSLRRHRWVFLGSRFIERDGQPAFVADLEGNLINLSFFYEGNTVLTAALPECESQTAWLPNVWLLPPTQSPVLLVFARERLTELPAGLQAALPELGTGR